LYKMFAYPDLYIVRCVPISSTNSSLQNENKEVPLA
jgi:hypothetical protein